MVSSKKIKKKKKKKKKKLCNGYMEIHVVGYMKQYV